MTIISRRAIIVGASAAAITPAFGEQNRDDTYSQDEIVPGIVKFFGVTAAAAGNVVAKIFEDNGRPNGYIRGQEGSGAAGVGLRYGKGTLSTKYMGSRTVYWQGPSIGFDAGGNASKSFTLVYKLRSADEIYDRFPGVDGSAYFVAGLGVNYQRKNGVTLAPIRAGVGLRAGASIGYLHYTRKRRVLPL